MFKAIKKMFTGGAQAPQQEPTAAPEYLFSDAEVKAIDVAHSAVHMQLFLSHAGKDSDTSCKIYRPEHVTPWVVGYMNGILDDAIQMTGTQQNANYEVLELFLKLHFDEEVMPNVLVVLISANDARRTGADLFGHGEQYINGAKAGFNCIPRDKNEAPRLELYRYLTGAISE